MIVNSFRVSRVLLAVATILGVAAPAVALSQTSTPLPADTVAVENEAHRLVLLGTGAVSAATWTQVIGMPDGWARTWRGYGNRLGDQVGFTATEEVLRVGLQRATGWRSDVRPCPGARPGRAAWPRLGAALSCGTAGAFVAHNGAGERRANVPLLGAIAAATAVSLAWRPERKDAHKGQIFLLTRVGISLGASVITRSVGAWRAK